MSGAVPTERPGKWHNGRREDSDPAARGSGTARAAGSTGTGEWTRMSNTDQIILDHTAAVGHGNTVAGWACVAAIIGFVYGLVA